MTQYSGSCFPVYNIELQINISGTRVEGASYHYSSTKNYVKKTYSGIFNPQQKKIQIQEGAITTLKIPADCVPCIKYYELWYHKIGDKEYLSGTWTGKIYLQKGDCQPGILTLSRVASSDFEDIPEIFVDTGMVRLDFYDNGVVDGDSITVFANGKNILSNKALGLHPVTVFIQIDKSTVLQEMEMRAENLGLIPPNTAFLLVTAGIQQYRLHLSASQKKNARFRLIYKSPGE